MSQAADTRRGSAAVAGRGGWRVAIVVLGAAVHEGGRPSPALRRRALHGAALALERPETLLLPTGGVGRFPPSEAAVMAELAHAAGVPRERLRLEAQATTTAESARLCAPILAAHGIDAVVLVSDAFHLRRAAMLFRRVGLRVEGVSAPEPGRAPWRERCRRSLREWMGLVWYGSTFRG